VPDVLARRRRARQGQALDRANAGRSTFYLHYRDKDDLLLSQLEMMSTMLILRGE
jgi:AcrR family transcriptional regulator